MSGLVQSIALHVSVLPLPRGRELRALIVVHTGQPGQLKDWLTSHILAGSVSFCRSHVLPTGAAFYQLLKRHNSVFPDGVTSGAVISPDRKASWQVFTPLIAPRVVRLTPPRLSAHRDVRHFLSSAIADRLRFQQFTFNLHPEESPKCHAVSVGI